MIARVSDYCLERGFLPVPVHFYTPVPDLDDLRDRDIWNQVSLLPGVDWDVDGQEERILELGGNYGEECDWPLYSEEPGSFFVENTSFSYCCAATLYCMIRDLRPQTVMEIGSGMSSRVIVQALRTNRAGSHTVVDPFPGEAVRGGFGGMTTLIESRVELLDYSLFESLQANDILFIDSSHVVRMGGDVNFLFLEVLPRLQPGVVVHVHDIQLPYEYPRVYAERPAKLLWTEQYLLRALLTSTRRYRVLLGLWYLEQQHPEILRRALPHYEPAIHALQSSSFWLTVE
jgi:hypothetical protein